MSEMNDEFQDTENIIEDQSAFFKPDGPLKNEMIFIYVSGILVAIWSFVWIGLAGVASGKWPSNPYGEVSESVGYAWNNAQDNLVAWKQIGFLFWALFVLSQIIWSYKAYRFTEKLTDVMRKWRRGWTIGGWFTPIGFLFIPYLVIRETESLIVQRQSKSAWSGIVWFSLSWISILGMRVVADPLIFDESNMGQFYSVHYVTGTILIISVLFAFIYFGDISSVAVNEEMEAFSSQDLIKAATPLVAVVGIEADGFLVEEQIRMLGKLHADGLLSDEEFTSKKSDLLGRI
jgi:hypothetical protein